MRLKFPDFIALAAFAGWFIAYMKYKKAWAKWLFGIVCFGSIGYIAFFNQQEEAGSTQSATTTGSNSPATIQSATASGSSTVIQAAPSSTVNNVQNGVSDSTLQQVLNLKDVELSERILAKYPHGCVILGLEGGKVIYDSRQKDIQMTSDWENCQISIDETNRICSISFPDQITIKSDHGTLIMNVGQFNIPYVENKPVSMGIECSDSVLNCEVLDSSKGIFLIGFRPNE